MDLALERVSLRLREPLHAAWGEVDRRELVLVRVREGAHEGVGEAGPLPGYDAPVGALDAAVAALEAV
ncbi:MAG: o-succinylbenzoate synthase, partial [Actinomycetota bacterium]|nr:o-succinylbenzoate synthase [Actinomycetota bacterium]